jgi:hypothetical protein
VAGCASSDLATGGLGMEAARRGRLGYLTRRSGGAMDQLERFFVALTMIGALGAAVSIAWIMLI